MPVAEDMIARARKSDRAAVEAVLAESYPAVHRMAHALTGDPALARRLVGVVMQRGARVMPRWRRGVIPENWFYHHTLLTARVSAAGPPSPDRDLLVTAGPAAHPEYSAFVRALRGLPRQQAEAFVLNHGEQLNVRMLGVAMDCSTNAATTHLRAATDTLKSMTGSRFPALVNAFEHAYGTLTPPSDLVHTAVRHEAGRVLRKIRLARLAGRLFRAFLLAVLLLVIWHWRELFLHWTEVLRAGSSRGNN